MDKEQLQTKVNTLQQNVEAKHVELIDAQKELSKAKHELVNVGKIKISQDTMVDLVERLQDVFQGALEHADTSDLSAEFSIDYDNRVVLDCIDMSAIEIHACDIESVLEDVFNVVDEEPDNS